MRITLFDILFTLAIVGGAAWGFYRGVFRQAIGTVTLYVSTVASTVGYRGLSRLLSGATGRSTMATDVLAFVILMAVLNLLFFFMGRELVGDINIERMNVMVNVTGMIFGFINAAFWCAIVLVILRSSTGGDPWIGYENIRVFLKGQTSESWMAYLFRPFMTFVLAIIKPWMFGYDLPPLLLNAL
jgi:uncharacterized membrane protein required for colicin V production